MARGNRDAGKSSGVACGCKPPCCRPHSVWKRALDDVEKCLELYQGKSSGPFGNIYVMRDGGGFIKIGYSENVAGRFLDLRRWAPGGAPLKVLRVVELPIDVTWSAERLAHKMLTEMGYHHHLEWFSCSFALASRTCLLYTSDAADE